MNLKKDEDYYFFILSDLDFYMKEYLNLHYLKNNNDEDIEILNITNSFTIADSLAYPLFLSPINKVDTNDIIVEKYLIVNKFIDIYTNIRMLCNRAITQSSIRNYFYDLVKETRNKNLEELYEVLTRECEKLTEIKSQSSFFQVDNWGYYHYFFARIIYSFPIINSEYRFYELLRSKKQSSFVLVQIFTYEELKNYYEDLSISNLENTIGNYCLIRRYEIEEFNNKQTRHKISFLEKRQYIPELDDYNLKDLLITEFIELRNENLEEVISNLWL